MEDPSFIVNSLKAYTSCALLLYAFVLLAFCLGI